MDANYDIFEIVLVCRKFWLFDAECYQRQYHTKDGHELEPGYYVVNWPEHIRTRRFNDQALFHGPFKERKQAQQALSWMHKMRAGVFRISAELACTHVPTIQQEKLAKDLHQEYLPVKNLAEYHWEPWSAGFPVAEKAHL